MDNWNNQPLPDDNLRQDDGSFQTNYYYYPDDNGYMPNDTSEKRLTNRNYPDDQSYTDNLPNPSTNDGYAPDTNSYPDYEQNNRGNTLPYMRDYRIQPGYQASGQNQYGGFNRGTGQAAGNMQGGAYGGMSNSAREASVVSYGGPAYSDVNRPDRNSAPGTRQNAYQNSQYGYTNQPESKGNGLTIAGLVLGILSILFFWTMPVAMILSIIGIVLSAIGLFKNQSRGFGIAGMVTSIIGGLLAFLTIIFLFLALSRMDTYDTFDSDDDYFTPFPYAGEEDNPLDEFDDFFDGLR